MVERARTLLCQHDISTLEKTRLVYVGGDSAAVMAK